MPDNQTVYVIVRNTLALVIGWVLMALNDRLYTLPQHLNVLLGAVFISGYITDNAIARERRRAGAQGAEP